MNEWWIFRGTGEPHPDIDTKLPEPPNWRTFATRNGQEQRQPVELRLGPGVSGSRFVADEHEKAVINAALYLRRPLFVTGKPGSGKSSLAYAVAHELELGPVLCWPITSRVTLHDGLYQYDAIGRLQEASLTSQAPDIGQYIRLGPLGTALLPASRPRVLLIDEIDKSDIDLPNDLLHVFEEGAYDIPELARMARQSAHTQVVAVLPYDGSDDQDRVPIQAGKVRCTAFPFIVLTSNGERQFPPAFLRRCLQLDMRYPDEQKLRDIVRAHLGPQIFPQAEELIANFLARRTRGDLATDQLLNALYLTTQAHVAPEEREALAETLLRYLTNVE
ncbi:MAG TPA: MoxR family ATPase [Ktedonobacteraceae bacterium]|jgi:MoxR-like ATPase